MPSTPGHDILARLSTLDARVSVYAQHVPTGREVAINADEVMNTASVIKIPILILAYRDAEAGRLDLDERREVTLDDYRQGSGLIKTFAPGLQPTLRDLVRQMIVTSDNIGTDIALNRVGLARVNALLAQLGYQQTQINMTTADLSRRLFILADPKYSTFTDRELYELGGPPVPPDELRRLLEQLARDPANWLGRSTARELSRLLLQLLGGELGAGREDEAPLVHAGMRDLQVGLVDRDALDQQDVDVEGPRAPALGAWGARQIVCPKREVGSAERREAVLVA